MINAETRRNLFFIVLGITLVVLVITWQSALQQERIAYQQYQRFQEATRLVEQGKFEQATPLLKELISIYPDSYQICWFYGICLGKSGQFKKAELYLERAAMYNPQLYFVQVYLVYRGYILMTLGEHGEAQKFLRASTKYYNNRELANQIEQYLQNSEQFKKGVAHGQE